MSILPRIQAELDSLISATSSWPAQPISVFKSGKQEPIDALVMIGNNKVFACTRDGAIRSSLKSVSGGYSALGVLRRTRKSDPKSQDAEDSLLVAATWPGKVQILKEDFSVQSEVDLKVFPGGEKIMGVDAFGHRIAVFTRNDMVFVLDAGNLSVRSSWQGSGQIHGLAWDGCGKLWLALSGGKVEVYDFVSESPVVHSFHAHSVAVLSIASDSDFVVTGGADAVVGVWDPVTMVCLRTFTSCTSAVTTVAINDGVVAWASKESGDHVAYLGGSRSGQLLKTVTAASPVTRLALGSVGSFALATTGGCELYEVGMNVKA